MRTNSTQNINDQIPYKLVKVLTLHRNLLDVEMKKFGLCRTEWRIFLFLRIINPCSQQELLKLMDIDAAHLTRTLDSLVTKGYVQRSHAESNRRSIFIETTEHYKNSLMPHIETLIKKEENVLSNNINAKDKLLLIKLLNMLEINLETALEKHN